MKEMKRGFFVFGLKPIKVHFFDHLLDLGINEELFLLFTLLLKLFSLFILIGFDNFLDYFGKFHFYFPGTPGFPKK